MADPSAITLGEALSFLGPLIGAGGVTAMVVAWFGSRKPSADTGVPITQPAVAGISALLSDSTSINRMAEELRRLTDAVEHAARAVDRSCDLMDISRAVNRLKSRK